jgi:hypothetical protein
MFYPANITQTACLIETPSTYLANFERIPGFAIKATRICGFFNKEPNPPPPPEAKEANAPRPPGAAAAGFHLFHLKSICTF